MKKTWMMTSLMLAMIAAPAFAFECKDPDITFTYDALAEREDIFFLFKGSIVMDPGQDLTAERMYTADQPLLTTLNMAAGVFEGEIFHQGGFEPFDADIEVSISCVMNACGDFPDESERLYIVQAADSNLSFAADMTACRETTFAVEDFAKLQNHLENLGVEGAKAPPEKEK